MGEVIRPVHNPSTNVIRNQQVAAARDGRLERKECIHPINMVRQFVDPKEQDRLVNLFVCEQCGSNLFIVDAHGRPAADG